MCQVLSNAINCWENHLLSWKKKKKKKKLRSCGFVTPATGAVGIITGAAAKLKLSRQLLFSSRLTLTQSDTYDTLQFASVSVSTEY